MLKHQQTQFLTEASDSFGQLIGYIVASFRVFQWSTGPGTPQQLVAVPLDVGIRDAIVVKDAALSFVCDGGANNFLYAVDTSDQMLPVILGHVDLSAA